MEAISNSFKVHTQQTQTNTPVTNTVNFKQSSGQDTVELSNKKEKGMSTGTKFAIGSVVLLGAAAAIDAIFNHGKLLKKIFNKAGNEVASEGEKIKDKLLPTLEESKTSFEKAKEFFTKNPKATSWTDDAGMVYTYKKIEHSSTGINGTQFKFYEESIEGILKNSDGTSVKVVYSGHPKNIAHRELINSRGTLFEGFNNKTLQEYGIKDNIITVAVDNHKICLNPLSSGKEQTCFIIEDGTLKAYPRKIFDQAKDYIQNGTKWDGLENVMPLYQCTLK